MVWQRSDTTTGAQQLVMRAITAHDAQVAWKTADETAELVGLQIEQAMHQAEEAHVRRERAEEIAARAAKGKARLRANMLKDFSESEWRALKEVTEKAITAEREAEKARTKEIEAETQVAEQESAVKARKEFKHRRNKNLMKARLAHKGIVSVKNSEDEEEEGLEAPPQLPHVRRNIKLRLAKLRSLRLRAEERAAVLSATAQNTSARAFELRQLYLEARPMVVNEKRQLVTSLKQAKEAKQEEAAALAEKAQLEREEVTEITKTQSAKTVQEAAEKELLEVEQKLRAQHREEMRLHAVGASVGSLGSDMS